MVSSVKAVVGNRDYDTGFHVSTPSPFVLQKLMKQAYLTGCDFFLVESTSHALDQNRILGSSVDIAVLTNIKHEHLDYHKSYDKYFQAKAKLFRRVKFSILNKDDESYYKIKNFASGQILTYSLSDNKYYPQITDNINTRLPGKFNKSNIFAAVKTATLLKIDISDQIKAIKNFEGVSGRMEEYKSNREFRIYIDFAHKPDALQEALEAVNMMPHNKIIVLFGCAGGRDVLKRPMMGKIASKLADYTILTAEDPRTEDVRTINNEIAAGCLAGGIKEVNKNSSLRKIRINKTKYFFKIPDRQEAINFAIRKLAGKGDIIICCGKGHEKSMCYGKVEFPWDEKTAIKKALYD